MKKIYKLLLFIWLISAGNKLFASNDSIANKTNNYANVPKFKYNTQDREFSNEYKALLDSKFLILDLNDEKFKSNIENKQLKDIEADLSNKKSLGKYIQFDFDAKQNKYPLGVVSRIVNDENVLFFKFENGKGELGHLIVTNDIDLAKLEKELEEISGVEFNFFIVK